MCHGLLPNLWPCFPDRNGEANPGGQGTQSLGGRGETKLEQAFAINYMCLFKN